MTPKLGALIRRGFVRGLSSRQVEALYGEIVGSGVSKRTVNRLTQARQIEFEVWQARDLSGLKVLHLLCDGQWQIMCTKSTETEDIRAAYVA